MSGPKLLDQAGLDEASRQQRLDFLQFGDEDRANLLEIREFARRNVDEIVDAFYAHLLKFEHTRHILRDDAQVTHLKQLQREYFLQMTEGRLDAAYFESRLRVGDVHQRIDLHPEWYLGTYNTYLRLVMDRLRVHYGHDPERLVSLIGSLSKVIFLDMGLALDAYIMGGYVHRALAQEYRRIAEVAKRTLREKEEVERMKADLSNMIVHDLKGPLGGILTTTQLALRKRGAVADAQARHFEQIQRSARDLVRMIENLLEIDQMQENRLELRVEAVEIGELLTECADEFRASAEMGGQTIRIFVHEDVPIIATDRWLMRRVLNNLVVNAIRHSGTTEPIDLRVDYGDHQILLRVHDTGRGISADEQATLFLKHRRRTRTDNRDDTGLGLVFCKMAVEMMGGAISVKSAPGAGATFTVTLPVAVDA